MSVEALAIAMHHFPELPDEIPGMDYIPRAQLVKLVLLGIANHDGDGGAWPTMRTLAKYAECDPKTARRAVRVLEHVGAVSTARQAGGTLATPATLRPNLYDFLLTCPVGCDGTTAHRRVEPPGSTARGDSTARPGRAVLSGGGGQHCPPNRPLPSLEPSISLSARTLTRDPQPLRQDERETDQSSSNDQLPAPAAEPSEPLEGDIGDPPDPLIRAALPAMRKAAPDITEAEAAQLLAAVRAERRIHSIQAWLTTCQADIVARLDQLRAAARAWADIYDQAAAAEPCGCTGGFIGYDDQDRPIPCPTCKPHLAKGRT